MGRYLSDREIRRRFRKNEMRSPAAGGSFSLEEGGVIDSQGLVNLLESFCPHRDMRVKSTYYYDPQSGNVFLDMVSKIDPPYRYEPEPSVAYEGMKIVIIFSSTKGGVITEIQFTNPHSSNGIRPPSGWSSNSDGGISKKWPVSSKFQVSKRGEFAKLMVGLFKDVDEYMWYHYKDFFEQGKEDDGFTRDNYYDEEE